MDHYIVERENSNPGNLNSLIRTMKAYKTGGVVTNVPFYGGYVDKDSYFDGLNDAVKTLFDNDFQVWLYDELGYPSGAAGGRTTLGHPEFVAKGLVYIKKEGNGKCPVTVEREDDLIRLHSAYAVSKNGTVSVEIADGKAEFEGVDGDWTLYVFAEKKLYEGDTIVVRARFYEERELKKSLLELVGKKQEISEVEMH
jgi:hypothetical protein